MLLVYHALVQYANHFEVSWRNTFENNLCEAFYFKMQCLFKCSMFMSNRY